MVRVLLSVCTSDCSVVCPVAERYTVLVCTVLLALVVLFWLLRLAVVTVRVVRTGCCRPAVSGSDHSTVSVVCSMSSLLAVCPTARLSPALSVVTVSVLSYCVRLLV